MQSTSDGQHVNINKNTMEKQQQQQQNQQHLQQLQQYYLTNYSNS